MYCHRRAPASCARNKGYEDMKLIRSGRACVAGKLTRKEYDAKVAKLRNAVTTGALTQDQCDCYGAERVACLK